MRILIDCKPFYLDEKDRISLAYPPPCGIFISGKKIKLMAGIPLNYGLWLKSNDYFRPDEAISNDKDIYLSGKELYHFFSGPNNTTGGSSAKQVAELLRNG